MCINNNSTQSINSLIYHDAKEIHIHIKIIQ